MMIDQTQLISSAFPLVGGGAIGFGVGYVIKKLMKLAFIGLGLVMLVLGFLEYKHWISVNWTVAENQSSAIMAHVANKIATVMQHMNNEIPIGMGLLGFAPGVLLGFYKG
ncbi:MAG TPA: FUN14 domain-containing protein [Candidatus Bathyarchaeia archaeon]|nr:FUN14 domain-containing protein [Candidatus Bathyarchaeia archaeon]